MKKEYFFDALICLGAAAVTVGVGLLTSFAGGCICGGAFLLLIGGLLEVRR